MDSGSYDSIVVTDVSVPAIDTEKESNQDTIPSKPKQLV